MGFEDLVDVENSLLHVAHLGVVRCLLTNPVMSDEWKRTTIFYTLIRCGETLMKMVIDDGSTMNVVAEFAIKRCCLKVESHPHPFKVAWVNKANLTVTHKCKVSIQICGYKDEILCDVLPMDVAHILLGRPWFYDLGVSHHDRENTYTFRYLISVSLLILVEPKNCCPP